MANVANKSDAVYTYTLGEFHKRRVSPHELPEMRDVFRKKDYKKTVRFESVGLVSKQTYREIAEGLYQTFSLYVAMAFDDVMSAIRIGKTKDGRIYVDFVAEFQDFIYRSATPISTSSENGRYFSAGKRKLLGNVLFRFYPDIFKTVPKHKDFGGIVSHMDKLNRVLNGIGGQDWEDKGVANRTFAHIYTQIGFDYSYLPESVIEIEKLVEAFADIILEQNERAGKTILRLVTTENDEVAILSAESIMEKTSLVDFPRDYRIAEFTPVGYKSIQLFDTHEVNSGIFTEMTDIGTLEFDSGAKLTIRAKNADSEFGKIERMTEFSFVNMQTNAKHTIQGSGVATIDFIKSEDKVAEMDNFFRDGIVFVDCTPAYLDVQPSK